MLRLISIKVEGFKNLEIKNPLEFPNEGNVLVMGLNESGKSSLFEAIFFSLTGKLLVKQKSKSLIDAINFNKNVANVELDFIKNKIHCKILRRVIRRGKGATDSVQFIKDFKGENEEKYDSESSEFSKQEIQLMIEDFLNFDGDILLNSSFVQQKDLDGFINTPKRKKEEIIRKLLGMANLDELIHIYDKRIKDLDATKEYLQKIIDIESHQKKIEDINQISKLLEEDHNKYKTIRTIVKQIKDIDLLNVLELTSQFNKQIETIEKQNISKQRIIEEYKRNVNKFEAIEKINYEIELNKTNIEKVKEQQENTIQEINQIERNIQKFNSLSIQIKENQEKINQMREKRDSLETLKVTFKNLSEIDKKIDTSKKELILNDKDSIRLKGEFIEIEKNLNKNIINLIVEFSEKKKNLEDLLNKVNTLGKEIQLNESNIKNWKKIQEINRNIKDLELKKEKEKDKLVKFQNIKINQTKLDALNQELILITTKILDKKNEKINREYFEEIQSVEEEIEDLRDNYNSTKVRIQENSQKLDLIKQKEEDELNNLMQLKKDENKELIKLILAEKNIHKSFLEKIKGESISKESQINKTTRLILVSTIVFILIGIIMGLLFNPLFISLTYIGIILGVCGFLIHKGIIRIGKSTKALNEQIKLFNHFLSISPAHESKIIKATDITVEKDVNEIISSIDNQIDEFDRYIKSKLSISEKIDLKNELQINNVNKKYFYENRRESRFDLAQEIKNIRNKIDITKSLLDDTPKEKQKLELIFNINQETSKLQELEIDINSNEQRLKNLKSKIIDINNVPKLDSSKLSNELKELSQDKVKLETEKKLLQDLLYKQKSEIKGVLQIEDIPKIQLTIDNYQQKIQENIEQLNKITLPNGFNKTDFLNLEKKIDELKKEYTLNNAKISEIKKRLMEISSNLGKNQQFLGDQLRNLTTFLENTLISIKNKHERVLIELNQDEKLENNWKYYEGLYSYDGMNLEELKKKFDIISKNIENKRNIEKQLNNLIDQKNQILNRITPKYQGKVDEFEKDYKKTNEDYAILEEKLRQDNDEIKKYNISDLIKNEKNRKKLLEDQKLKIENIKINLNINQKKLASLKQNLNSQISKKDSKTEIERLSQEIKLEDEKKVELNTKNDELIKKYIKLIKELQNSLEKLTQTSFYNFEVVSFLNINLNSHKISNTLIKDIQNNLIKINSRMLKEMKQLEMVIENRLHLAQNSGKIDYQKEINDFKSNIKTSNGKIETLEEEVKELKNKPKWRNIQKILDENLYFSNGEIYDKVTRDLNILKKAKTILKNADEKITKLVLPTTRQYLARILPILTADRYKDIKIESDVKGKYSVQVYDSNKGEYVEKIMFSGGTNDQIALAIRLAFAMAVMGNSNYDESFIFLDEPLGFFDDERKNSLIDFLTRGWIAEKFSQRFVVSNFSQIEKHFDYIIELENGRIINEISTGSVRTIISDIPINTKKMPDYLTLRLKDIYEEESWCEYCFEIENKTNQVIRKVELSENQIQYKKIIHETLKSKESREIELDFNKEIIDDNILKIRCEIYTKLNEINTQILKFDIKNKCLVE
ncbi:MAG: AAA family ATPase [Promethearchaeota archaeon]